MSLPFFELTKRIRAPFLNLWGPGSRQRFQADGWNNDFIRRSANAANTDQIDLMGTDALDNMLVGGGVSRPFATPIRLNISANGKIATTRFFSNANDTTPLAIVGIDCIFSTADGATNTGYICKEIAGQAPGSGTTCMSGTFNLNATANTLQSATLAGAQGTAAMVINAGEHLSFSLASAVTSLAGLVITVWVRPATGASIGQYVRDANADIVTATFYLNLIPGQTLRAIAGSWRVAATNAGAVTFDVTKDTGTNAPGAGSSVLAAAQSVKGTINTTVYPALSATASLLKMAAGDRLAVKITGTTTALLGLVVIAFFSSSAQDHIVIPVSLWDALSTDRTLFISNGHYIVSDYWETWSVASSSLTQLLTKDTGTTAPGGGTGLLTDNTNTGILTSATANTPVGSLTLSAVSTKPTLWLAPGDRLGLKNAGTATGIAGTFSAIVLRRA